MMGWMSAANDSGVVVDGVYVSSVVQIAGRGGPLSAPPSAGGGAILPAQPAKRNTVRDSRVALIVETIDALSSWGQVRFVVPASGPVDLVRRAQAGHLDAEDRHQR